MKNMKITIEGSHINNPCSIELEVTKFLQTPTTLEIQYENSEEFDKALAEMVEAGVLNRVD